MSVHRFLNRCLDWRALGIDCILHASDGKEALELIEREKPEICILDIEMPVMDGLSVLRQLTDGMQTKILILSAYDQFEYARQCVGYGVVDYLLKPIDIDILSRKMQLLRAQILEEYRGLLSSEFQSLMAEADFTEEKAAAFAESFRKLQIRQYGIACARCDAAVFFPKEQVPPLFQTTFQQTRYALFSVERPSEWESLYRNMVLKGETSVGFSRLLQDVNQLADGIRQARDALQQSFYQPGAKSYQEGYFSHLRSADGAEALRRVLDGIRLGNMDLIGKTVDGVFADFSRRRIRPDDVYRFCCTVLIHAERETGAVSCGDFHLPFSILSENGCRLLRRRFIHAIGIRILPLKSTVAKTDAEIVREIKGYVDTHYDADLSLEDMSSAFFMSKYQVSRLFKKLYGINYQDYLLQIRMDKAKLMLLDTSMKLYEIAQKSGFKEASYFSAVFKKYYGLSPHEFRSEAKQTAAY